MSPIWYTISTDRSCLNAYIRVNGGYFEPVAFWCILFVLSILVLVNLIDINMCKVLMLREMCYFCV